MNITQLEAFMHTQHTAFEFIMAQTDGIDPGALKRLIVTHGVNMHMSARKHHAKQQGFPPAEPFTPEKPSTKRSFSARTNPSYNAPRTTASGSYAHTPGADANGSPIPRSKKTPRKASSQTPEHPSLAKAKANLTPGGGSRLFSTARANLSNTSNDQTSDDNNKNFKTVVIDDSSDSDSQAAENSELDGSEAESHLPFHQRKAANLARKHATKGSATKEGAGFVKKDEDIKGAEKLKGGATSVPVVEIRNAAGASNKGGIRIADRFKGAKDMRATVESDSGDDSDDTTREHVSPSKGSANKRQCSGL